MKTWKIVLLVVAGIAAVIGAFVAVIFYATSGVTEAGDEFFEAARRNDYQAAYALASAELRNDANPQELQAFIEGNGFDEVTDTSWSSRSIQNNVGNLEGTLTTADGGTIPIKMRLVKEGDAWKISYIEKMPSGLSDGQDAAAAEAPPADVVANLVRINTGLLAEAARQNDHELWAGWWAGEMGESDLRSLIDPLRGHPDLINALGRARPRLESMRMGDDGLLEANANYQFNDAIFEVRYRFARMDDQWKVAHMEYELK